VAEGKSTEMTAVLKKRRPDDRARRSTEFVTDRRDHDRPNKTVLTDRWSSREDDNAYWTWSEVDGATDAIAGLVAGASVVR